ncbi:MAG: hypothetical protein OHK0052_04480 [Anaerolineales bacterium]
MQIRQIICSDEIETKLIQKHHVTIAEVHQILFELPRFRFVEKGYIAGEDVYVALGQTFSGRYLAVFFIYKPKDKTALIISSRDMTIKERKAYGHK